MKRRYVGFALFLIILGLSIEITVFVQAEKNTKTTIMVGHTTKYSYQSIQQAINDASPGSTIFITSGTYYEILKITKPLTITGENKENTILAPVSENNGYAVYIASDDVSITQFSITNKGSGLYTTGIKITGSHTFIEYCLFYDSPIGIALWSSDNTIQSCSFQDCSDEGIALLGSSIQLVQNNQILNCVFSNNCDGIELQHSFKTYISECTFTANTHAGIDSIGTGNSDITMNKCSFNDNLVFGVYVFGSTNTKIESCVFRISPLKITSSDETLISNCDFDTNLKTQESVTMVNCVFAEPQSHLKEKNTEISYESVVKAEQYSSQRSSSVISKVISFIQAMRTRFQLFKIQ